MLIEQITLGVSAPFAGAFLAPAGNRRSTISCVSDETITVDKRVEKIVGAAEETAERLRKEAETRMRERIAEGDRAARNRVEAAEDEAADIVKWAQEEAVRARQAAHPET